jgi:DNA-binding HxlR family transcriptional regulator
LSTASVVRFSIPVGTGEGVGPESRPTWGSPVEITAAVLRGRWTAVVVWHLFWGDKRFYQLLRETRGIHRRALAHELEQLERLGIVTRRVRQAGPSKVQYGLTPLGESLKLVVGAMYEWGLLARDRLSIPEPPMPAAEPYPTR